MVDGLGVWCIYIYRPDRTKQGTQSNNPRSFTYAPAASDPWQIERCAWCLLPPNYQAIWPHLLPHALCTFYHVVLLLSFNLCTRRLFLGVETVTVQAMWCILPQFLTIMYSMKLQRIHAIKQESPIITHLSPHNYQWCFPTGRASDKEQWDCLQNPHHKWRCSSARWAWTFHNAMWHGQRPGDQSCNLQVGQPSRYICRRI
jgi:hypothetical protein